MKRKRNLETFFLLWLRKIGMLCKPPKPYKPVIKISSTVYPDRQISSIDAERRIFLLNKLTTRANCKFDVDKLKCRCGADVDQFLMNCKK